MHFIVAVRLALPALSKDKMKFTSASFVLAQNVIHLQIHASKFKFEKYAIETA